MKLFNILISILDDLMGNRCSFCMLKYVRIVPSVFNEIFYFSGDFSFNYSSFALHFTRNLNSSFISGSAVSHSVSVSCRGMSAPAPT